MKDIELIDFVFQDIAGDFLDANVKDYSDYQLWETFVNKLDPVARNVYLTMCFIGQSSQGGISTYYSNSYGIFAFEAAESLKIVGCEFLSRVLKNSLSTMAVDQMPIRKFKANYASILTKKLDNPAIDHLFDNLDNLIWNDIEKQAWVSSISGYIRRNSEYGK